MSGKPHEMTKRFALAPNVLKKNPTKCSFTKGQRLNLVGKVNVEGFSKRIEFEEGTEVIVDDIANAATCLYNVIIKETDDGEEYIDKKATDVEQTKLSLPTGGPPPPPPPPPDEMSICKFQNTANNKVYLNGSIPLAEEDTEDLDSNVDLIDVEATVIDSTPVKKPNPCLYTLEILSGDYANRKTTKTVTEASISNTKVHGEPPPPAVVTPPAVGTGPSVIRRAKISSVDQLNKGGPTGRELIHLAGQKYYIDYDKEARKRRAEIFSKAGSKQVLKGDEPKLLEAIGLTDDTRAELSPHLAEFFNTLPSCQTSSQMITNRKCETAYYIIWSVLLKARQASQKALNSTSATSLTDTETYMLSAATDAMSGVPGKSISENDSTGIMAIIKQIETELADIKTKLEAAKNKKK